MITKLSDVLYKEEINTLTQSYVFGKKIDSEFVDDITTKLSKALTYEMRKHSHSPSSKNRMVSPEKLERLVWKEYIHNQIDEGLTTGDISKQLDVSLEFINERF